MIQGLKKRLRSDVLENEKRMVTNPIGRMIYLGVLAVFGVAVLNFLFGDILIMRADGLVLKDQTVIATTFSRAFNRWTSGKGSRSPRAR